MEMSNQVVQVIDALCEKFGLVIDWSSENVIPYLNTLFDKFISYEIWTSVAWMILMLGLTIPSILLLVKYRAKLYYDYEELGVILLTLIVILSVVTIICLITQSMDIITCLTFPEKQIFEYIQGMISNA